MRWVTSLAPMRMTAMSGLGTRSSPRSTWAPRCSDSAPMAATLVSSTGRPLKAATPLAMVAPIVWRACSAPMPAPVESPSTRKRIGSPGPKP